eukprot:9658253-Alexandrium_andersonii.AAC.1
MRTATRQRAARRSASGGASPLVLPPGILRLPSKGAPRTVGCAVTWRRRSGSERSSLCAAGDRPQS